MIFNTYYLADSACVPVSMQTIAYSELTRLDPDTVCERGVRGKCCDGRNRAKVAVCPA